MIPKTLNISPPQAGPYPEDTIPDYILKIQKKLKKPEIVLRDDILNGQVVIVLEGEFTGMRVVVAGRSSHYLVCIGIGIPMFKIDERYVLVTSVFLDVSVRLEDDLEVCGREYGMANVESNVYNDVIYDALDQKGMSRSYMVSRFEVAEDVEFYEMRF